LRPSGTSCARPEKAPISGAGPRPQNHPWTFPPDEPAPALGQAVLPDRVGPLEAELRDLHRTAHDVFEELKKVMQEHGVDLTKLPPSCASKVRNEGHDPIRSPNADPFYGRPSPVGGFLASSFQNVGPGVPTLQPHLPAHVFASYMVAFQSGREAPGEHQLGVPVAPSGTMILGFRL